MVKVVCPKCYETSSSKIDEIHGKKSTCPKCKSRIILSDRNLDACQIQDSFNKRAGILENLGDVFGTKLVHVSSTLVSDLITPKVESLEIYAFAWLVPIEGVCLFLFGKRIANLPTVKVKEYEQLVDIDLVLQCSLKLTGSNLLGSKPKWGVFAEIPFLQVPKLVQPPQISPDDAKRSLMDIKGKLPDCWGAGLGAKDATLREVIAYLSLNEMDSTRHRTLNQERVSAFYGTPEDIIRDNRVTWVDNEWKFEVTIEKRLVQWEIIEARELSPNFHRLSRTQVAGLRGSLKYEILLKE